MSNQGFDFRWGVPLLDNQPGFAKVYEFMLDHYAEVVTRDEFLCIIHLARYHYNSERGESRPALATIAKQMGYGHKNSVYLLVSSLENKGMLAVTRRSGFTSVYNAAPFTLHMMALAGITTEGVTTHCGGSVTTHCGGGITTHCERESQPLVPEEEKDKGKKKKKQQQEPVVAFSKSSIKTLTLKQQASYTALTAAGIEGAAARRIAEKVEPTRVAQVCLAATLKESIDDKSAWIVAALNNGWKVRIPREDDPKPRTDLDRAIAAGEYRVKIARTGEWVAPGEI